MSQLLVGTKIHEGTLRTEVNIERWLGSTPRKWQIFLECCDQISSEDTFENEMTSFDENSGPRFF